ncbi:MAG: hypothetical protein LKG23_18055 [Nitrospira sp.]|nr:hypothetical protein [Nitrospira sp.]
MTTLRRDLLSLQREAAAIREQFGTGRQPKFHMSLYALLMAAFAQVDLFSALREGKRPKGDKKVMRRFLADFTSRDPSAIAHAIQLYRHTTMHTGRPRELVDPQSGQSRYYLLHWGRTEADEAAHLTVDGAGKLTMNLECLLEDVVCAFEAFASEVRESPDTAANVTKTWPQVVLQVWGP